MSNFIYETLRAGTTKDNSDSGAEVARKFNDNFQKILEKFNSLDDSLTKINESIATNSGVIDAVITKDGELVIKFLDGSEKNLGIVVDGSGSVYVPHVSAQKILTFTIEEEPTGVPDPVDLNPNDEWSRIDETEKEVVTDYVWDTI